MIYGQASRTIYIGELRRGPNFEELFQNTLFVVIKIQGDGV